MVTMMCAYQEDPKGHVGGNRGRTTVRPHFLPQVGMSFCQQKDFIFLLGTGHLDVTYWEGQAVVGKGPLDHRLSSSTSVVG